MFRCFHCKELIGPNVRLTRVVLTRREKTYLPRSYEIKGATQQDPGGVGWEIEKEVAVCETCRSRIADKESLSQ